MAQNIRARGRARGARPHMANLPEEDFPALGAPAARREPPAARRQAQCPGQGEKKLSERVAELNINSQSAAGDPKSPGPSTSKELPKKETKRDERLITRPAHAANKKGTSGNSIPLLTNYFRMLTAPNWAIYLYRVDFSIEEDRTFVKKAWFRDAVANNEKFKGGYLFDGSQLFSIRSLVPKKEILSMTIIDRKTNEPVQISVRLTGQVQSGELIYHQIFNLLLRRVMENLNLKLIGRKFYDAEAKINIPQHNIQLWPGYITSIRQNEQHVQMVAEITYKVVRTDTVFDLLKRCLERDRERWERTFKDKILGEIVLTGYNNRTYRVADVDFSRTPSSEFPLKNNEKMTYLKYYQTRYQTRIRDPKQPLLVAKPTERDIRGGRKEPIMLIPELSYLTGLDDAMRSNYKLTQDMAIYTRVNPEQRIERLLAFNRRIQDKAATMSDFQQWNVKFSPKLVEVQGRVLDQEKILVARGQSCLAGPEADWTHFFRSKPMYNVASFQTLAVVVPKFLRREVEEYLFPTLQKASSGLSFRIPQPDLVEVENDSNNAVLNGVENYISRKGVPSLMMFIFPSNKEDRYNAIKRQCCVWRAIPSQVILKKNICPKFNDRSPKPSMSLSIATKIAIQLNCKLGGVPWAVEKPACMQNVMFIGYDTCHDPMNRANSWGAFVASLNGDFNLWFSATDNHKKGEELSSHMSKDVKSALEKYKSINGKLPSKIIMYRDGVGEGQLAEVYKVEVENVKKALTQVYSNNSWKLGYCIVTKRINTRLFSGKTNPKPGTIVDDVITNPDFYDFFLVSQSVRQGTASPTYYNVISDNMGMSVDEFQRITYKMTHLYFNWTGTVAVPAPCQYAHKLSLLVSKNLQKNPNEALCTKLFFL